DEESARELYQVKPLSADLEPNYPVHNRHLKQKQRFAEFKACPASFPNAFLTRGDKTSLMGPSDPLACEQADDKRRAK
ncbi:MAG: hypothetical protein AB1626_06050, partial [Candidatus Micrarchaeota archaeon]